jgi:Tubulin binding cofactor C
LRFHSLLPSSGPYKALHFVNVEHSSVHVLQPIGGAVHVTQCRYSSFALLQQVHQLRIHDSHHLDYHIVESTGGGTILEDCHHVTFYTSTGATNATTTAPTLDIKDFNWLRNGIPSPNFSIKSLQDGIPPGLIVPTMSDGTEPMLASTTLSDSRTNHVIEDEYDDNDNDDRDDDDDEEL